MIRVEFDTDNAAFEEALENESARILRVAADLIENGSVSGPLLDANGNTVGFFEVVPSKET